MAERGREPIIATGRGGAGNMVRSPSRGRGPVTDTLPPASAIKAAQNPAVGNLVHSGRGGAGNVRSPSRDPLERQRVLKAEQAEHKLQADYAKTEATHYTATGRGGAGNIQHANPADAPRGRGEPSETGSTTGGAVGNILRSLSSSRSRSRSREPRPTDRRRPSTDAIDSPNERSLSRSRAAGASASTTAEGGRGLPAVSENGGGSVGVLSEEDLAAANGARNGEAAGTHHTSIKDKILGSFGGGHKAAS
ncbi:unnamed protein product [Tilletia controversa]|uniref:Uncharacterized protein n=1 Tax=Tilletia controversa TaxID=13291 RepID=A0A8X7N0I9_9BASI|nr:hypothetical protein CF328_g2416 [Tilletia controversa]KAE8254404.1 hypothetical protein A4X06_0g906 [Tilletia controversa]CAD6900959.1 unnamed protein product [Tilletia controversa]